MATPFNGTVTFTLSDGTTMAYDAYCSDAAGAVRFNPAGTAGTGSPDFIQVNNGAVITGLDFPAATTMVTLTINFNDKPQQVLRFANVLNTLATRTRVAIAVPAGTKLTMTQA